jgi:hypothetical protein
MVGFVAIKLAEPNNDIHTYLHTTDHVTYDCIRLNDERDKPRTAVKKKENWPINKTSLIKRYHREFSKFINSISFDKLNSEVN